MSLLGERGEPRMKPVILNEPNDYDNLLMSSASAKRTHEHTGSSVDGSHWASSLSMYERLSRHRTGLGMPSHNARTALVASLPEERS